ncbi:hypothetical protein DU002_10215 [Corallincola holothuriorum]|uniref:Uncharacterized protein n=1 Tax=Corallincola holothuriorum TaxID=2282215 RepID=A0A368NKZ4_9GAMM|nr:hypothetical protein DU002_10215 [Corallincola holothuriorum]
MNESEIYSKLEELRSDLDPTSEKVSSIAMVEIDGESFEQRIWSEMYENSKLFVCLLEVEKTLCTKAYCLGLLVGPDGQIKKLSTEQLWDIGIP